jgi:HAE1 family hydrophobic/amphiphilic exporter-1
MLAVFLLSFLLIYMVLCAQLESFKAPFIMIMSVPLAFSGAFAATLLSGAVMSIYTMIGLILLMGLVTKNGILLIDFALERVRTTGQEAEEAIRQTAPLRLKPILMTTFAMILGMMPIVLSTSVGAEARASMAIAIIGGLVSSTFLTLLVIPCVFSLMMRPKKIKPHKVR